MLFDIPKNVVFAETLVFSNIFGFPAVNWAPKWNKTVNFRCLPFELNSKFWSIFQTLSFQTLIGDHLWSKFQQNWTIFWGERAQKTQERVSWMLNQSKKVWKILISPPPNAILMKLITNIYLKVFHLAKSWSVTHKVQEDINKKAHKMNQKDFWRNSDHFLILQ